MTANKPGDPTTLNRLYGRSSGHKLRAGQQDLIDRLLPQISVPAEGPVTAQRLFGDDRPLQLASSYLPLDLVRGTAIARVDTLKDVLTAHGRWT